MKIRDLEAQPYSADEARVVDWLWDHDMGAGDDPIGFLMAAYECVVKHRNELGERLAAMSRSQGATIIATEPDYWRKVAYSKP